MGPPDGRSHCWALILLPASFLTLWSLPTAPELTLDADLLNIIQNEQLAKPTISVSKGAVIERKETVTFFCDTKDMTIRWVSNNRPLVIHERIQLAPDGRNFTITPVLRGDSGSYQCEAGSAHLLQSSDPTYLVVNYGPDPFEIKVEPSVPRGEMVGVLEGSNVTFSVEIQSHPPPRYSWSLPNDSTSRLTRTFTIHAVSREHEGTYKCQGSNHATQLSYLASLQVQVLESLPKPHIIAPSLSLVENTNTVPLTCWTTREGAPVQWLLRGQPLLPSKHLVLSADNRTLIIHSLWRDDTGPYECEVWYGGSWTRSEPLRLTIHYGPDHVNITRGSESSVVSHVQVELNSSLTLQCRAESQPDAEYHWSLEPSASVYAGEKLVIEALTWEHQGTYNCTALNPQTHLARSASVLVTVVGPQWESLSAGSIAGITVGILSVIALSLGLGYFLYTKRCPREPLGEDPTQKVTTPTSEVEHPAQPSSDWPRPTYNDIPELQGQASVNQMPPPEPPEPAEHVYEKQPPSATPGDYTYGPRKPPPKSSLYPPDSTLPQRSTESTYEVLMNADCSIYCRIESSA